VKEIEDARQVHGRVTLQPLHEWSKMYLVEVKLGAQFLAKWVICFGTGGGSDCTCRCTPSRMGTSGNRLEDLQGTRLGLRPLSAHCCQRHYGRSGGMGFELGAW
jgi:hypothetical protein